MKPGIYHMDPREYQRDRTALSSTWARKLLPPTGNAAKFKYLWEHGDIRKAEYDLGSAAHLVVLGRGSELVVVDKPDWRTREAQDAKKDAHIAGQIPLLTEDLDTVEEMAAALRAHPIASNLLEPGTGDAEIAFFWEDVDIKAEFGDSIMRRCMLDWYSHKRDTRYGRLFIPEYKTTKSAERTKFMKSVKDYGYHVQAAWARAAYKALGVDDDPAFVWIAQEKDPPYLVNVIAPDSETLMWGEYLADHALRIFRKCRIEDAWPGYSEDIEVGALPGYATRDHEETLLYLEKFLKRPEGALPL